MIPAMDILMEAHGLVFGERQEDYGHPCEDFARTAKFWNTYLVARFGDPIDIQPEDVAMLMILLKVSREANRHKTDNLVDIAGYAQTAEMCQGKEAQ